MSKQILKVGSRGSNLALAQVEEIKRLAAEAGIKTSFLAEIYETSGDIHKDLPLDDSVPDDFWTNTLDRGLLEGEIDLAIHSAKDLPQFIHPDLRVICLTKSEDETDCYVGRSTIENLPGGSRVGTSSDLRKSALAKLNSGLELIPIRGTIEERIDLVKREEVDGIIVATIAMKRLGLKDQIKEIMPWETTPLQGSLAIVARVKDVEWQDTFEKIDIRRHYGRVQLVGAGPGDPELITVKGVRALKSADVIFYDYLAHPQLLDYAPNAEKIYVGKRKDRHAISQKELNEKIRLKAIEGKSVVRLKGGDPFIFGRGAEEIQHLRSFQIPVEVIAGVSSATGVPSQLEVPLTARDISSSVAFVSGHVKDESRDKPEAIAIPDADTIVFLMGLTKLNFILKGLKEKGWLETTPILIISKGTCWNEKVVHGTLKNIQERAQKENLDQPALIVVGQVTNFYQPQYKIKETILFTGTNPQKYNQLGRILYHPMIELSSHIFEDTQRIEVCAKLASIDYLMLTSPFAVRSFCAQIPIAPDRTFKILVIGEETSRALQEFQYSADFISPVETSEGFFDCIKTKYDFAGKHILFPRSDLSNPYLKDHLKEVGASVEELTIYENQKPAKRELPGVSIQKVVFTSPSTVRHFLEDYQRIPEGWQILAKGPTTQKFLKDAGYSSVIVEL